MNRGTSTVQDRSGHRRVHLLPALLALAVVAACSPKPKSDPGKVQMSDEMQLAADKEFVRQPFQDQTTQGVLRQRTIFEHEFEAGSARLTPIGQRDVRILAGALRDDGGSISVRQGSASAELYAARRDAVRKALIAEGIASDRVRLNEAQPGGPGVGSAEALQIRERIQKSPMKPPPSTTASTSGVNP